MKCARNFGFVVLAFAALGGAQAGNQLVRINEVLAGLNADSGIQFVELAVQDEAQKKWGPRGAETGVGAANWSSSTVRACRLDALFFPTIRRSARRPS